MSQDFESILDECLSQMDKDGSIEACIARYPALAAELEPLLHIASQCRALREEYEPAPGALQAGRQKFLREAARLKGAIQKEPRTSPLSGWLSLQALLRRSAIAAVLVVLLVVVALGSGTIAASAKSLPGDTLYPVKRMAEDLQLALTLDRQAKAQLLQKFDERRRQEAVAITSSQRIAELSFRGHLDSRDDSRWSISGVPVYISNETMVEGHIEIGMFVRVHARSLSDGKLWATRIVAEPAPATPSPMPSPTPTLEPTASPTPTQIPATALPIPPLPPVLVTPTARPTSTPRPSATPTATAVPATLVPSREVKIRFKGRIEAITAGMWTIGSQSVRINTNTRILDQEERAAVGVTATVLAIRMEDGTLLALEITTERPPPTPEQLFEFQGLIESFGTTQWFVGGYSLLINTDTVIEGTPMKGLLAEVKAVRQSDGTLRAQHITIHLPSEEVQFEGSIQALSAEEWIVDGTLVHIDAQSAISGTPVIGYRVEIQGLLLPDGSVLARRILVQAPTGTPTLPSTHPPQGDVTPTSAPGVSGSNGRLTPRDCYVSIIGSTNAHLVSCECESPLRGSPV